MSSTEHGELSTAQQAALSEFATALALLDAVPTDAASADAQKRLKRARMLHNVLTAKFPEVKLDDLAKMGAEWLHGMLDASYPAETALVDGGCAEGFEPKQTEAGGAECVPCEPGWHGTQDSKTQLRSCKPCASGTLQPLRGQTSCLDCPAQGVDCAVQDAVQVEPGCPVEAT